MDDFKSGVPGPRFEARAFFWLVGLFFILIVYPLFAMLWYHRYPLLTAEVGILLSIAGAFALTLALLLGHARQFVTNIAIVSGITITSLVQFNLLLPGLMVVLVVSILLALLFGKKFQVLVLAAVAAATMGAWFDNALNPSTRLHELAPATEASGRGPIVHILMDGFIGPDGLPDDRESQKLRSEVMSFFKDYDFSLSTRAYSHYATTADSMTRMFNFRNDDENIFQRAALLREPISFRNNAWFGALDRAGYQIVVYQTESIDFCTVALERPIACNVYPMPNLGTLHENLKQPLERAVILLRTLASQSSIIKTTLRDRGIVHLGTWGVGVYDERLMSKLSQDIKLQPGNAFFAHVLVPHAPSIYREDCSIDYDSEPWTRYPHSSGEINNSEATRAARHTKIVPQIRCAVNILRNFFDGLKAQGLYNRASIIVHGDHGTSAFRVKPSAHTMDKLRILDLREAFSTLFAVKLPGGSFRIDEEVSSLNVLMADTASEITGDSLEELGVEVAVEREPFVYLSEAFPLLRVYVNMFGNPQAEPVPEANYPVQPDQAITP